MGGNGLRNVSKIYGMNLTMVVNVIMLLMLVCVERTRSAATARPLEHSPGELAWAAWQQEPRQPDAPIPPRRITTKSLFVFPHLGTEALPACAEGYRPDSMGRCVKVVKVDETAHLEFLLQRLNSQFATETSEGQDVLYDYDSDTEVSDTSGPFQFNIPIAMQVQAPKPEDSDTSDDTIVLFKKEVSSAEAQSLLSDTKPTSSPEVVPDYDKKLIAAPNSTLPNATDSSVPFDNEHSAQNSTILDVKLMVSTNGKFENFTTKSDELIEELESIKSSIDKNDTSAESLETASDSAEKLVLNPSIDKTDSENPPIASFNSSHETKDTPPVNNDDKSVKTDALSDTIELDSNPPKDNHQNETEKEDIIIIPSQKESNDQTKTLVEQIEALKDSSENNQNHLGIDKLSSKEDFSVEASNKESAKEDNGNTQTDLKAPNTNTKTSDIEDKIKEISRFADVTRNMDENLDSKTEPVLQKKTSNNNEKLAFLSQSESSDNPVRSVFPPSNLMHFPLGSITSPHNYFDAQKQLSENEPHNRPVDHLYNSNMNYNNPQYGWSPQDHNINNEHSLMKIWSRMPIVPEYPFNGYRDYNQHSAYYQTHYPDQHQSGSRLNTRHTATNHRRGRPLLYRDSHPGHQESLMYLRGRRHPDYRE